MSVFNIRKSFATRLSTIIVLLVAIIFAMIFTLLSIFTEKLVKQSAEEQSEKALAANIMRIRQMLLQTENAVHETEWMVYSHINTPDSLHSVTQHLVRKNSTIVGSCAALVPENKVSHGKSFAPYSCIIGSEIIDKQLGSEEYDYVNKDWYKNAISSGKTCWSEPYFDKDGINKDICTLSSPLRDNDGNIFAVFTADISLEWLTDIVNEGLPFENSYALITNAVGTYVIHPKKERIAKGNIFDAPENIDNPETQAFARNMIAGKSGQTEIKEDGDSYFVCYAPINQTTWSLAIVSPLGDIFSIHNKMSIFMFIGLILSLLIISGVCVFIIKRITKPLSEFSAAALRISQGYFNIALPEIKVKDEIWELRESLDQMQYNLSRYTNRLKEVSANQAVSDRDEFIASKIQVQMLPPTFEKMVASLPGSQELQEGLDVAATLIPQQMVGGDFYYYQIINNHFMFCIGDVSGKGVPASMIMSANVMLFRCLSRMEESPAKLLTELNKIASESNKQSIFTTMFVGSIDLTTGRFVFSNAGHIPPLFVGVEENVEKLEVDSNLALAIDKDFVYAEQEMQLHRNNLLLLCTDGVIEAEDNYMQAFGESQLIKVVQNNKDSNAKKITEEIIKAVDSHRAMNNPADDFTLLAIKFLKKCENLNPSPKEEESEMKNMNESVSLHSQEEEKETSNEQSSIQVAPTEVVKEEAAVEKVKEVEEVKEVPVVEETPPDFTDHITLQNQATQIRILERFVQSIADYFKISDDLTNKINMALEEAVINIISYAYPAGGNHQFSIDVEHRASLQLLTFIIIDDGIQFNPFEQEAPDITLSAADRPIGGLGIHIIREVTYKHSYAYEDNKNVLTLSFKLLE